MQAVGVGAFAGKTDTGGGGWDLDSVDKGNMRSVAAYILLTVSFTLTLMVAKLGRRRRIRRGSGSRGMNSRAGTSGSARMIRRGSGARGIVVTGTFYNHNWFLSHCRPLARANVGRITFVADEGREAPEGVEVRCPPRWMAGFFGRAMSKLIWMGVVGFGQKPDVFMGYHLFPGAMSALIVGRLLGGPVCYQMTGGPIEVVGGGHFNENALMSSLAKPSRFLERLALATVREFDLVVVRGREARKYLLAEGVADDRVKIITGSTERVAVEQGWKDRPIDLLFLGRLTAIKQPEQFVSIVAGVRRRVGNVRAVVIGDGPELARLEHMADELGVSERIDFLGKRTDVADWLIRARVFVMTSKSEGMSIALAEAMGCGLPAVVGNVGELGELVQNGVNGWLVEPGNIDEYVERVVSLIEDETIWTCFSRAAIQGAEQLTSVPNVAARWRECLMGLSCRRRSASVGASSRSHPSLRDGWGARVDFVGREDRSLRARGS